MRDELDLQYYTAYLISRGVNCTRTWWSDKEAKFIDDQLAATVYPTLEAAKRDNYNLGVSTASVVSVQYRVQVFEEVDTITTYHIRRIDRAYTWTWWDDPNEEYCMKISEGSSYDSYQDAVDHAPEKSEIVRCVSKLNIVTEE